MNGDVLCYLYVFSCTLNYNIIKLIDSKKTLLIIKLHQYYWTSNTLKSNIPIIFQYSLFLFVFTIYPFPFVIFYYVFVMYFSAHYTRRDFVYINIQQGKYYYTIYYLVEIKFNHFLHQNKYLLHNEIPLMPYQLHIKASINQQNDIEFV